MVFYFGIRLAIIGAMIKPTVPCNMMSMTESCSQKEISIVKTYFINNIVFEGDITEKCRLRWEAFNCAYQDDGVFFDGCDATELANIHGNRNITGIVCDQYRNEFVANRDCFKSNLKIDEMCILPWEDTIDDCNLMHEARQCVMTQIQSSCDGGAAWLMAHVLNGYFRPFAEAYGCDELGDLVVTTEAATTASSLVANVTLSMSNTTVKDDLYYTGDDVTDDVSSGSGNGEKASERSNGREVTVGRSRAGHPSSDHVHTVGAVLGCVLVGRLGLSSIFL